MYVNECFGLYILDVQNIYTCLVYIEYAPPIGHSHLGEIIELLCNIRELLPFANMV